MRSQYALTPANPTQLIVQNWDADTALIINYTYGVVYIRIGDSQTAGPGSYHYQIAPFTEFAIPCQSHVFSATLGAGAIVALPGIVNQRADIILLKNESIPQLGAIGLPNAEQSQTLWALPDPPNLAVIERIVAGANSSVVVSSLYSWQSDSCLLVSCGDPNPGLVPVANITKKLPITLASRLAIRGRLGINPANISSMRLGINVATPPNPGTTQQTGYLRWNPVTNQLFVVTTVGGFAVDVPIATLQYVLDLQRFTYWELVIDYQNSPTKFNYVRAVIDDTFFDLSNIDGPPFVAGVNQISSMFIETNNINPGTTAQVAVGDWRIVRNVS